jgi:hypothetical protein
VHAASKFTKHDQANTSVFLIIAALCLFSGTLGAGALYKWVDENGQIRYSDRLPPNQVTKKHQQLNSQGVVVTTKEAAKTDEELAAEAAARLKLEQEQAEAARIKKIQDEKDNVLLLTFSSEEELGLAREGRIEVIESVIQLIEKSIISTQETLADLEARAAEAYTSKGNEVPGGLAQKIEHFTGKIESRQAQLELKQQEKERIERQYQLDLARYRDLKAQKN